MNKNYLYLFVNVASPLDLSVQYYYLQVGHTFIITLGHQMDSFET